MIEEESQDLDTSITDDKSVSSFYSRKKEKTSSKEVVESKTSTVGSTTKQESRVKLFNRTSRNIELDFGRDKELRIPAREFAIMDVMYLEHPQFLAEKSNFIISKP